jgi:hypothetical protein
MNNELHIPLHRSIDKEAIRKRIQHVGVKGLDIDKAEELGLMSRISNLLCAMHCLMMASNSLYGQVNFLFDMAQIKKHEIKRACQEFQQAYDRWYKFWREYQTVGGVQEMNREAEDLVEQYMRWAGLPVRWELGDPQDAPRETEPLIEIDRDEDDSIWRLYRDVAESETMEDDETEREEWAVFSSDPHEGVNTMTCEERGIGKADVQMVAKRMSAADPDRLYTANRLQVVKERRLEVIPVKAFLGGQAIGSVKSVIVKSKKKKDKAKDADAKDAHI